MIAAEVGLLGGLWLFGANLSGLERGGDLSLFALMFTALVMTILPPLIGLTSVWLAFAASLSDAESFLD